MLCGCSELPREHIDAANSALQKAKTSGADLYLPHEYLMLQDSFHLALSLLDIQESKLIKNYGPAKKQLVRVVQLGTELTNQTEAMKSALRSEIRTTMNEVTALIEDNRELILDAPKGKDSVTILMDVGNELNSLELILQESRSMMDHGEYIATLRNIRSAREEAVSINNEIKKVLEGYYTSMRNRKT